MAVTAGSSYEEAFLNIDPAGGIFISGYSHDANSRLVTMIVWLESTPSAGGVTIDNVLIDSSTDSDRISGPVISGGVRAELWWANVSGGSHDVELVFGGDLTGALVNCYVVILSANGSPTDVQGTTEVTGSSTSPSVTITATESTGLVVNVLGIFNGVLGDTTLTPAETEVQQGAVGGGTVRIQGGMSTTASVPGSQTTGWTLGGSRSWAQIGVELIDASLRDVIGYGGVIPFPR